MSDGCPFCQVSEDRVAFVGKFLLALWDGYPVTEGHLLLVPKRHVATWSDLDEDERTDLVEGINAAQEFLRSRYSLDGFNIGFNEGEAAGQTVPHFHIHVIPRRIGDMADPRGGVRHVIPEKGNYLGRSKDARKHLSEAPHDRALIAGGEDALIQHLLPHIQQAHAVDIAVSFMLDSGVRLLLPHLQELLKRGGQLRLVAGDYLNPFPLTCTASSGLNRLSGALTAQVGIDQYPLGHYCPRESKGLGPCWYVEILLPTYRRGLGLLGVTLHQPGR